MSAQRSKEGWFRCIIGNLSGVRKKEKDAVFSQKTQPWKREKKAVGNKQPRPHDHEQKRSPKQEKKKSVLWRTLLGGEKREIQTERIPIPYAHLYGNY